MDITNPTDELVGNRRRARDRHCRCVHDLLEDRHDLRGVHPLADLLGQALLWSA